MENLQQDNMPVINKAHLAAIVSEGDLRIAKEIADEVKNRQNKVNSVFDPIITAANKAHKEALAQKKKLMDPLVEAENHIKRLINDYLDYVESEQKKEAGRITEIARKEQETRLQKIQTEIDEMLSQSSSVEEKISKLLEAMAESTPDKFELINNKLADLYSEQDKIASNIAQKREDVSPLILVQAMPALVSAPKVRGLSRRVNLDPHVVDPMQLIKAVATGNVPSTVIEFNMSNIKRLINGGMKLPGVAVNEKRTVSVRRNVANQ